MKTMIIVVTTVIFAAIMTANASEIGILTPVAAGTAIGSDACHQENAFDNQPTWDGTKPVNASYSGNEVWTYGGRYCYIDFGSDWADWRVVQTWTRYREWSLGDQTVWEGGYWSTINPATNNVIGQPLTEFGLQFQTQSNLPMEATPKWYQDSDMTGNPFIPSDRYLVMKVKDVTAAGNDPRGQEYAMVGYKVPEPASMTLLGLGAFGLLRRRK